MTDKGAGLMLRSTLPKMAKQVEGEDLTMTLMNPTFTSDDVCDKFYRILTEPSFKENMMKINLASKTAGGRELAVDTIERTYVHY